MKAALQAKWRYSLRWRYSHGTCPGPQEIAGVEEIAGAPCPAELLALWTAGGDYGISIDFGELAPTRRWSPERKSQARRHALAARVHAAAPLFAEELIERALATRPDYFAAKTSR